MKICSKCRTEMRELKNKTSDNIEYRYYKCSKCREEIVSMEQLYNVAEKYRKIKSFF